MSTSIGVTIAACTHARVVHGPDGSHYCTDCRNYLAWPREADPRELLRGLKVAIPLGLVLWAVFIAAVLALASCAPGTEMQFSGTVCGQQVDLTLTDRKDRAGFDVQVDCGDGAGVRIASSESSYSAVIAAQGQIMSDLAGKVVALAGAVP